VDSNARVTAQVQCYSARFGDSWAIFVVDGRGQLIAFMSRGHLIPPLREAQLVNERLGQAHAMGDVRHRVGSAGERT
jgi:hypothetical protein